MSARTAPPAAGRILAPVLFAFIAVPLSAATPPPSAGAPPGPERPRLVVFIAVDQLKPGYLVRFRPLLTGGLKRFVEEGAVFPNARYAHANTETGPGHAVLLSGRHARDTGIVANDWYDRLAGHVNVVDDPVQRPVPETHGRAASPVNMIGATVGDLLKKDSPLSRVVGVAVKDRAAILMAGRRADAAYWYGPSNGLFGTSTYYMDALPAWLAAWNAEGRVDRLKGASWTRLLPDPSLYERYAGPDDVRGEWDDKDTTFPHRIRGVPPSAEFYEDVRRTPFADEITLEVALLALDAHELGRDAATDVFTVGFSATDSIGHTYGEDSQEVMDQILRLDRVMGRLMEAAEARAGKGRVLFGLSADHGGMPLVEVARQRGLPAQRVHPDVFRGAVRGALESRYPHAKGLVAAYFSPDVYFDLDAIRRHNLRRSDVEATASKALLDTGLVERVYTHAEMIGGPAADDQDFPAFLNAFFEPRSPHLVVRLKPYIYVTSRVGGTGHGTVHDYDRHVSVVFAGAGIRAGTYDSPMGPHDVAPTLAALLGLEYRLDTNQRVLSEALASAPRTAAARVSNPGRRVAPGRRGRMSNIRAQDGGHRPRRVARDGPRFRWDRPGPGAREILPGTEGRRRSSTPRCASSPKAPTGPPRRRPMPCWSTAGSS